MDPLVTEGPRFLYFDSNQVYMSGHGEMGGLDQSLFGLSVNFFRAESPGSGKVGVCQQISYSIRALYTIQRWISHVGYLAM